MKKQTGLLTLGLLLATPALAGGGGAPAARPAPAPACKSIAQIVKSDSNFSTLASALDTAGLTETLMSGSYTVFAPTNAAFAKLPSDQLAAALNDPDVLRSILLYHVVPGKVNAAQVKQANSINTVQGSASLVTVSGGKVMIDNATVTKADIAACNGIVHVIDTVLMPAMETAEAPTPEPTPTTEAPAPATEAPAAEAPAAEAPAAEPAPAAASAPAAAPAATVLSIPALPQGGATTSAASTATSTTTTTTTDTSATTTTDTSATSDVNASAPVGTNTCYDTIVADDRFSSLRDLLSDAGLTDTLINDNLTVFAPTNDAFDALDQDQLALISSDPAALKQLLTYHVVANKVTAEQLTAGDLTTAEGSKLTVTADGDARMIGDAKVDTTAITADNCLIYPVNAVLIPDDFKMPEAPAGATGAATEATATTAATTSTATTTTATTTTPIVTALSTNGTALVTLLQGQPQFSTLLGLIQQAGLVEALASGEHTLFAPTNDAFAKIAPADLSALRADPAKLKAVLLNHVVAQRIGDSALAGLTTVQSAQGSSLAVTKDGEKLKIGDAIINGASSIGSDALNLTIYPIDTVLLPK